VSERPPGIAPYWLAGVIAAALLVMASAVWFAASYVDAPPDGTCGSVIYPQSTGGECRRVMPRRRAVTGVLAALGVGLILTAPVRPDWQRAITVAAAGSLALAILTLVVNEFVRSGGFWATG
jgi:hypothetical protein